MNRCFDLVLLALATTVDAGRKMKKVEEVVVEEAVHIKLLKSSAAPFNYVIDQYSSLAVAQYFSLLGLIATIMAATFALWAIVKMTDPEPYLYNNGKLGPLETKSVFVCSQTGKFVAPKPKQCATGPDGASEEKACCS